MELFRFSEELITNLIQDNLCKSI